MSGITSICKFSKYIIVTRAKFPQAENCQHAPYKANNRKQTKSVQEMFERYLGANFGG